MLARPTRRRFGALLIVAACAVGCGLPADRPNVKLTPAPAYLAGLTIVLPKIEGSDEALPKLHEKISLALVGAGYRLVPEGENHDLSVSTRATVEEIKMPFEMTRDGVKQIYLKISLALSIDVDGKVLDTKTVSMTMVNREVVEQHGWNVVNEMTDSMPFRRWAMERTSASGPSSALPSSAEPTVSAEAPVSESAP